MPESQLPPRPRYQLVLEALPPQPDEAPPAKRLARLLKALLRNYRFRCVTALELPMPEDLAVHPAWQALADECPLRIGPQLHQAGRFIHWHWSRTTGVLCIPSDHAVPEGATPTPAQEAAWQATTLFEEQARAD